VQIPDDSTILDRSVRGGRSASHEHKSRRRRAWLQRGTSLRYAGPPGPIGSSGPYRASRPRRANRDTRRKTPLAQGCRWASLGSCCNSRKAGNGSPSFNHNSALLTCSASPILIPIVSAFTQVMWSHSTQSEVEVQWGAFLPQSTRRGRSQLREGNSRGWRLNGKAVAAPQTCKMPPWLAFETSFW